MFQLRRSPFAALGVALLTVPACVLRAQNPRERVTTIDSIAVQGADRVSRTTIVSLAGIPTQHLISFRDVQRAIAALYASGQFEDVRISEAELDGRRILLIEVTERPLLADWMLRGVEKVSERTVRGKVTLAAGRPYDPTAAAQSRTAIDSLYTKEGFYRVSVQLIELPQTDGSLRVIFDIDEGSRVAISQITINGNEHFTDDAVSGNMKNSPEGFWWFQRGEYNETELDRDLRERLPRFYRARGHLDFHVIADTLLVHEETGKGELVISVSEGERYEVGTFEIVGNQQFPTQVLEQLYPFAEQATGFLGLGGARTGSVVFDGEKWEKATQELVNLYYNNGYLYADVRPLAVRRTRPDGTKLVDLRWQIVEGSPAIVNKIIIRGNSVTHEDVIRRAIIMVPGDVFRQEAMIQSYRRIQNLGFFEEPLEIPKIEPANSRGDVDVIFTVKDRNTGNLSFGASVGQGTGLGGFIGLDQPNLFGRGKRVTLQWQFGSNISDFNITYSDPAIRASLISGTLNLHRTRLRYTFADLGRIKTRGGSLQLGIPLLGSRFTRVFASYTLEESDYDSPTLQARFNCANCILSSVRLSIVRDTRIDLPFATAGAMHQLRVAQTGGPLRGSGDFRRVTFEGRWYAPLGEFGGGGGSNPLRFVLGFTSKAGFVWGDPGPHFRQLFALGGTQFGIPLRGYNEFSITPVGFDPSASGNRANVNAFGRSYLAMTGEIGLRISQILYINTFIDAGNVWESPGRFNPTRLFRGAGVGINLLSPLGPLGLDYAYGFDRTDGAGNPDPGFKLHFRLGNFF